MSETDTINLEITADYFTNEGTAPDSTRNWAFPLIFVVVAALGPILYCGIKQFEELRMRKQEKAKDSSPLTSTIYQSVELQEILTLDTKETQRAKDTITRVEDFKETIYKSLVDVS